MNTLAAHGTHVMGIINAQGHENKGLSGIAPKAQCIMIKICDQHGNCSRDYLLQGLHKATFFNPRCELKFKN